jgi:hypothetical protein
MQELFRNIYKRVKSTALRLFPSHKGKTTRVFRFYQQPNGRWFVDLPEWKGANWHLEMVAGADDLLNEFKSTDKNDVRVLVSLEPFDDCTLELSKIADDPHGDGADYSYFNPVMFYNEKVWLCGVTEWYFGFMPEKIFLKNLG